MKKVAIYARVSTYDQQTLPLQTEAMQKYVQQRGWQITLEFQEVSSALADRKMREQIMQAARRREIDVVLVWKLDRWGRSLIDLMVSLQELQALGVGFVSITEALDFTTPLGKAMAGMLAVFAQFERDLLSERVKAGIAHARSKGQKHGRPLSVALKAEQVIFLHKQGFNISQIAKKTEMSRTSVRRILRQ